MYRFELEESLVQLYIVRSCRSERGGGVPGLDVDEDHKERHRSYLLLGLPVKFRELVHEEDHLQDIYIDLLIQRAWWSAPGLVKWKMCPFFLPMEPPRISF